MSREVLSPTPPVECLAMVYVPSGLASKTSPELRIASVRVASSAGLSPRRRTAIRNAAIWASVTVPVVVACTKARISPSWSGSPSRLC